MKKIVYSIMAIILVLSFMMFAVASSSESGTADQGNGTVQDDANKNSNSELGQYSVEILGCRLAKTYDGKNAVIVKYKYTNVLDDNPTAFYTAFDDTVYQEGVGLNKAYVLEDRENYSEDNQTKKIKKGSSLEIEVAYELNDVTSNIEVEVKELFSFNDKVVKKTFEIKK